MRRGPGLFAIFLVASSASGAAAQPVPATIATERAEFSRWLAAAPTSPYRAIVQHPIGAGITLGPAGADIPLAGVGSAVLEEKGRGLGLTLDGAAVPIARDRAVPIGTHRMVVSGPPGRSVVTVFAGQTTGFKQPTHFPYAPDWRFVVDLKRPARPKAQRMLAPDGTEVEATEAGTVTVPAAGKAIALRVFRIPGPGGEESELEIYFRDGTNGSGSYPAGRFVVLVPAGGGRYELDFNRARQPFCGYSTVYPCPAPWRGNTIPLPVPAGERYAGGGLDKPPI